MRDRLAETMGLEARQVFMCGTHTHSAPKPDHEDYRELFVEGICGAVQDAAEDAAPARVMTARRLVYGISFNRRVWQADGTVGMYFGYESPDIVLLDGPIDPVLGVFSFEREERPRIVLANFSLHACTAGGGMISADFPAAFEDCLREVMREPLHLQFTNAPCGNHDLPAPADRRTDLRHQTAGRWPYGVAGQGRTEIEGTGAAVRRSTRGREYTPENLRRPGPHVRPLDLGRRLPRGDEAASKLRGVGELRHRDRRRCALARRTGVHARRGLRGSGHKRSPLYPHTFAVELAYDDISYVPTREAFPHGGYTVYSCRFVPGTGEEMAETALEALAEVGGG